MIKNLNVYLKSKSTQYGFFVGLVMYLAYACPRLAFDNILLLLLCLFVGFFIPFYSRISNKIEEYANFKTAIITSGRLLRFIAQFVFNIGIFYMLKTSGIIQENKILDLGGFVGISALTTAASQGLQYIMLILSNRDIGDKNRNVLIGLSINVFVTALATLGCGWIKILFYVLGISFGTFVFGIGIVSDLRCLLAPKGGIGIFIGTFNPFHKTHLKIIIDAISDRKLEKVYLHCTDIPKLHLNAMEKGEIIISSRENGMRVYKKTEKADVNVNYFPTGDHFFEFETRVLLMKEAIKSANLDKTVEVLSLREIYKNSGFYGIIKKIKQIHPNNPIHGIHGSDLGGMLCRNIYDECGWIYPYSIKRKDNISATSIRKGAKGLTTPVIEELIDAMKLGVQSFRIGEQKFYQNEGVIVYGKTNGL